MNKVIEHDMKTYIGCCCILLFMLSCGARHEQAVPHNEKSQLKDYRLFALNEIKAADFLDQAFPLTDGFYLWSFNNFGKDFATNRITRVKQDGFYHYLFWTHNKDTSFIYQEDSVSIVQHVRDSLYDANGDGYKDLTITYNNGNGKCPITFMHLFTLDTALGQFARVAALETLPNITFKPQRRSFTSIQDCDDERYACQFKWRKNFSFDTVDCKQTKWR